MMEFGSGPREMDAGKLRIGIVSWTDPDLVKSGKFYPKGASSPEERLKYYSGKFPIVEVDMSTYRVPDPKTCEKWAKATADGFMFHFKIYHLWTHLVVDAPTLPSRVFKQLPDSITRTGKVLYEQLADDLKRELWAEWNESLRPVHEAGKLGVILFQFPPNFGPSRFSEEHILHCRAGLNPAYRMCIELRHLGWFTDANIAATLKFLRENTLSLVWVDEPRDGPMLNYQLRDPALPQGFALPSKTLAEKAEKHEKPTPESISSTQSENGSISTQRDDIVIKKELHEDDVDTSWPGRIEKLTVASHMYAPIEVTNPAFVYIRVHRRAGEYRLLSSEELNAWAVRLRAKAPELQSIWMVWNTHHDNHAVQNAQAMAKLVPELSFDWNKHVGQAPGKLDGLFARAREKAAIAIAEPDVVEIPSTAAAAPIQLSGKSSSHPPPTTGTSSKKPRTQSAPAPGTGHITRFFKKVA